MGYFVAHDQSHSYKLTEISKDEFTHYYSRSQIGKPLSPRHLFDGSNLKQHRNVKALSQNIKPLSPRKYSRMEEKHSRGKRRALSRANILPGQKETNLATREKHSRGSTTKENQARDRRKAFSRAKIFNQLLLRHSIVFSPRKNSTLATNKATLATQLFPEQYPQMCLKTTKKSKQSPRDPSNSFWLPCIKHSQLNPSKKLQRHQNLQQLNYQKSR